MSSSAVESVIVGWVLFISSVFPSDAVLIDYCNEFMYERNYNYEEVVGSITETPGRYTAYVRLKTISGKEKIAPVQLVKLDNSHWLIHRSAVDSGWLELKTNE